MKKILFIALFFFIGCDLVQSETKQKNQYFNQDIKLICNKFLEKNIRDTLVCDAWDIRKTDIKNILKNSRPYEKNFVSTARIVTQLEIDQERLIKIGNEDNDNIYIFYPNGLFIESLNKHYDTKDGYSEINQSYVCDKKDCEKYFMWSFIDEQIAEKLENNQINHDDFKNLFEVSNDIIESKTNIQIGFYFNDENININSKKCLFKNNDCKYIIYNDYIYIYHIVSNDFIDKILLKN